jgi:hypothetical protein
MAFRVTFSAPVALSLRRQRSFQGWVPVNMSPSLEKPMRFFPGLNARLEPEWLVRLLCAGEVSDLPERGLFPNDLFFPLPLFCS